MTDRKQTHIDELGDLIDSTLERLRAERTLKEEAIEVLQFIGVEPTKENVDALTSIRPPTTSRETYNRRVLQLAGTGKNGLVQLWREDHPSTWAATPVHLWDKERLIIDILRAEFPGRIGGWG